MGQTTEQLKLWINKGKDIYLLLQFWLPDVPATARGQWRVQVFGSDPIADFNYDSGNEKFGRKLHELMLFVGVCQASSVDEIRIVTLATASWIISELRAFSGSESVAEWRSEAA